MSETDAPPKARWNKRGQVFDVRDHPLPFAPDGFAQSPQALVRKHDVRVYFSCRQRDVLGKFVSRVAYADFDFGFTRILRTSAKPVIAPGAPGTFDEHGIFPLSPLPVGDQLLALTTGWTRRQSVSTDGGIGLVISHDGGETFIRSSAGPILSASLHEPFLVSDGFALAINGRYHLWYIHGVRWLDSGVAGVAAERVYKIAHAVSSDLVQWQRTGRQIIRDRLNADECQAVPTVIEHGGRWHMVFCYRHAVDFRDNPAKSYRLGHASSADGVRWDRDDNDWALPVSSQGWDADMACYPNLFKLNGQVHLLYNGNQFGRFGFGLAVLEDT